ncbi:hypothetical protein MHU86_13887 [Fragilaria crotonensis]|nr:hypothetical protein MHU86_13887 [Fragilaria crotonensis]
MHPQQPHPPLRITSAALGGGISPQQQHCPSNTAGTSGNLPEYSHAMEKLCETMRRSAMSRTMVKQLSGRSLPKQGSSRSLPKQASSRKAMLQKHLLTRNYLACRHRVVWIRRRRNRCLPCPHWDI